MPGSQAKIMYAGCLKKKYMCVVGCLVGGNLIYYSDLELRPRWDAGLQLMLMDIICKVEILPSALPSFTHSFLLIIWSGQTIIGQF